MDSEEQSTDASHISNDTYEYDYDWNTDEICDLEASPFRAVIIPVLFSAVVVVSLLGNILVMVLVAKYENLRSLTNTLILNLAVSDLIFTVGLPFWAYYHMYGWHLGEMACKIVVFTFYMGFYSSGVVLILMTVQRYVSVMRPLSDLLSSRGFVSALASAFIWALGLLAALPALLFSSVVEENTCEYEDVYWKDFGIYQQNTMFLVTVVVFCFCYTQILCRLMHSPARRRRHRTLKLISTLVLVFFIGWGPYNVLIFLQSITAPSDCEAFKRHGYAFYVSRLIAYSHCCLNPVFYVFVGVKYKNHMKRMLKGWGKGTNSLHSRHSRLTITSLTSGDEFSM